MKLYNRTKIDTAILESLLVKAGRSVGARTSNVIVKVNSSRGAIRGMAYRCSHVRIGTRYIATDGGMFFISIPSLFPTDPLSIARTFFDIAQHEFYHVKEYQDGNINFSKRGAGGRRARHDSRPEEIRAYNAVNDTELRKRKGEFDSVILDLAIDLERIYREKIIEHEQRKERGEK